jgi:hypothetical protein
MIASVHVTAHFVHVVTVFTSGPSVYAHKELDRAHINNEGVIALVVPWIWFSIRWTLSPR